MASNDCSMLYGAAFRAAQAAAARICPAWAEDAAAEAVSQLWCRLQTGPLDHPTAWAVRAAVSLALNRRDHEARWARRLQDLPAPEPRHQPEAEAEAAELEAILRQRLPAASWAALLDAPARPTSTTRARRLRARRTARAILEAANAR